MLCAQFKFEKKMHSKLGLFDHTAALCSMGLSNCNCISRVSNRQAVIMASIFTAAMNPKLYLSTRVHKVFPFVH